MIGCRMDNKCRSIDGYDKNVMHVENYVARFAGSAFFFLPNPQLALWATLSRQLRWLSFSRFHLDSSYGTLSIRHILLVESAQGLLLSSRRPVTHFGPPDFYFYFYS